MRAYHVTITMPDGSKGLHLGRYHDSASAADRATALFPEASSIDVLRLSSLLAGARRPARAAPADSRARSTQP